MTDQTNQAAQVEPSYKIEGDDQAQDLAASENQSVDSATTNQVDSNNDQATSEPAEDGFQKRINKVTADKYTAIRERDALQLRFDALSKTPSQEQVKAPTLEDPDIDYDEDKFRAAQISFGVRQELAKQNTTSQQAADQVKAQQSQAAFSERITALGKEDFSDKANAIPELPTGVAAALTDLDNGAELIYHLGSHLDQADALANMSPMAAMVEIGRMSAGINKKQEIKPSAAPDPIQPLSSGGAISSERGPAGATFE